MDFIPEIPGNEFELIGKALSGSILEVGENGLMLLSDVMRDTIFLYPARSRVHELTDPEGKDLTGRPSGFDQSIISWGAIRLRAPVSLRAMQFPPGC